MTHVEIVGFDHDNDTQRILAVVTLVDGHAEVEVTDDWGGVPKKIQHPATGEWVDRSEGAAFLELLPYRFSGSYLAATSPHDVGAEGCAALDGLGYDDE